MTKAHWRDWMSDSTWLLIKQRTSLRRAGQLRQSEGRRMQRAIHAALKRDHTARTAQVGELIVAELAEGKVGTGRPRIHMRGLVFRPWNGRGWSVLSFTGGATRLASPSSSTMQRCVPTFRMTPLMRRYFESQSRSLPIAAARECRRCGQST